MFHRASMPEGLRQIIEARAARIPAGMVMELEGEHPVEQPEGVSDEEWQALGDPGKRAIVRERERATKAENDLAAVRAAKPKPAPPKAPPAPNGEPKPADPESPDVAALIQQAVTAAMAPLIERDQQREATDRTRAVVDAVREAAKGKLHDSGDALVHLDLTTLVDEAGNADAAKVTAAIDGLMRDKPHLAAQRRYDPSQPIGGAAPSIPMDERVKAALRTMQASAGVKLPD